MGSASIVDVQDGEVIVLTIDEYISRGQRAAAAIDLGRWLIGDDALAIETSYGGKEVEKYATGINVPKERVQEYRTVCKFYPLSARAEFLESNPTITYTHMREAMRLKELAKAWKFLRECSQQARTVELARIRLTEMLGKPVPPIKDVFDVQSVLQAGSGKVLLAVRECDLLRHTITYHPDATITVTIEWTPAAETRTP